MKTLYTIKLLLLSLILSAQETAMIDNPSEEIPAVGVRYYFYPNLDAYYDSHQNNYVVQLQGRWTRTQEIQSGYRGYSVQNNVRVPVTDYNGEQPQTKLELHRKQFPKNYTSRRKPPKNTITDAKMALN